MPRASGWNQQSKKPLSHKSQQNDYFSVFKAFPLIVFVE